MGNPFNEVFLEDSEGDGTITLRWILGRFSMRMKFGFG
jgi:hypothetical protein